ncbi:MAG: DUF2252 domain-containing protein [Actinomycetota bacterium]|nr:DUF2252 domain-containing protein [Actinomycetota bacterium]MDH5223554.1 DUF2252 domain-containing protein [Actinomycetota bacterium]MDH5312445.1 DUF2252 domain-containing protein [Actinomycetota bacterium]
MTQRTIEHLTLEQRRARGKEARDRAPRSSWEGWSPRPDRPDPTGLLETQNTTREPDLVPVRHGRMMVSPFTFYRGGAKIMAADLQHAPRAGLEVQLCGDAHLSNFGVFASPERTLLFDLNDFDETLPGPFEYDIARLAASFVIAARNNGFTSDDTRAVTMESVTAYLTAMRGFAKMSTLDVWYSRLDPEGALAEVAASGSKDRRKLATRGEKVLTKARTKNSLQALSKLTRVVDGRHEIISDPPVLIPGRELLAAQGRSPDELREQLQGMLRAYRSTLSADRRRLLERFEFVDFARKVVGVGSVGTRAWIALLQGRDADDPLFLQVKEATSSVLEDHLPKSAHKQPGERVVQGQRLMQAASDIFLGWTKGIDASRFYYWRQLRDMKGSVEVESMVPTGMTFYAGLCGWTLARAHARSGDPVAIAAYLGSNDRFGRSMTEFAERYADQNERDYEAFVAAIGSGRLEAVEGV